MLVLRLESGSGFKAISLLGAYDGPRCILYETTYGFGGSTIVSPKAIPRRLVAASAVAPWQRALNLNIEYRTSAARSRSHHLPPPTLDGYWTTCCSLPPNLTRVGIMMAERHLFPVP